MVLKSPVHCDPAKVQQRPLAPPHSHHRLQSNQGYWDKGGLALAWGRGLKKPPPAPPSPPSPRIAWARSLLGNQAKHPEMPLRSHLSSKTRPSPLPSVVHCITIHTQLHHRHPRKQAQEALRKASPNSITYHHWLLPSTMVCPGWLLGSLSFWTPQSPKCLGCILQTHMPGVLKLQTGTSFLNGTKGHKQGVLSVSSPWEPRAQSSWLSASSSDH